MRTARAVAAVASAALAGAAAPPPGATSCSGCHAGPGRAEAASAIPSIHGRPAAELAGALRAFRAGERPASVMDRIARGFSDGEMDAIAAWIAAQR